MTGAARSRSRRLRAGSRSSWFSSPLRARCARHGYAYGRASGRLRPLQPACEMTISVEEARMAQSPSTKAGKYVKEEIHHVRQGKHGARSTKQAIAIGLSKARRKGVKLPPPRKGRTSAATRRKARQDLSRGRRRQRPSSRRKSAI